MGSCFFFKNNQKAGPEWLYGKTLSTFPSQPRASLFVTCPAFEKEQFDYLLRP